jgi:PST family polysaccharide transporter
VAQGANGKAVIAAALRLRYRAALVNVVIGCGLAFLWPNGPTVLVLLLLPVLLREPVIAVMMWCMANGNIKPYFNVSISSLCVRVISTLTVYFLDLPLYFYVLPLILENVVFIGFLLKLAHQDGIKIFGRLPGKLLGDIFMISGWGWLSAVAALAGQRLDRLFLSVHISAEDLGIYAAAAQINDNWYYLGILLAGGLGPALIYRADANRVIKNTAILAAGTTLICLIGASIISFGAPYWTQIIFGVQFERSAVILSVSTWAIALVPIDMMLALPFLRIGRMRYVALKNIIVAISILAGSYMLFPVIGIYAPVASFAFAYVFSILITVMVLKGMKINAER